MTLFKSIAFIQDSQDFESFESEYGYGIDGFFESEEEDQINYLLEGIDLSLESETELFTENPKGASDSYFEYEVDGHTLGVSLSPTYGYAGICEILLDNKG